MMVVVLTAWQVSEWPIRRRREGGSEGGREAAFLKCPRAHATQQRHARHDRHSINHPPTQRRPRARGREGRIEGGTTEEGQANILKTRAIRGAQ